MSDDRTGGNHAGEARARWREERTTFQRVYDVVTGTIEFATAKEIGERADCSADGARTALLQLVEMGVAERRGDRPVEYRRNESYLRWKRIETLAREHSAAELREELDGLLEEDESFQERFEAPDPDAISPAAFESSDHDTIHDRWDALTRWRSVREDIAVLQRAIHRADEGTDGRTGESASA
jgi:hypothetical protein